MKTPSRNTPPPGPRSWIPGGVRRELRKSPLDFLTRLTREYGDVSSFRAAFQTYVVLNHPDLVREVLLTQADAFWKGPALQNSKGILGEGLLTAEGEMHRAQRKLMTPAFHARHVESYAPEMLARTHELAGQWITRVREGPGAWDVRPGLMGLTLVIAGNALFGTMLAAEVEKVHRCMDDLMNNYVRAVVPWGWILNRLPLASTKKLKGAQGALQGLVTRIIGQRRAELAGAPVKPEAGGEGVAGTGGGCPFAGKQRRVDLLSLMIAATDEESGDRRVLSDTQLRDQCITILTAGHETTANALTFTLYLLAKHPEQQQKLREEVRRVLGRADPTPDLLDGLVRTRWVLLESMRLLPPAWTLGRQNQRAVTLGGYTLPPKCTILIPQWTLHRDPRFWSDPLGFVPERWENPTHPRYAYIPFSTGARNCIGESFAWLELMLVLPLLIRDLAFALPPGPGPDGGLQEDLRLTPAITLRPKDPVILRCSAVE